MGLPIEQEKFSSRGRIKLSKLDRNVQKGYKERAGGDLASTWVLKLVVACRV